MRSFGLQVGWWPCLRGPFISLAFNRRRYEVWFGLPSYLPKENAITRSWVCLYLSYLMGIAVGATARLVTVGWAGWVIGCLAGVVLLLFEEWLK